MKFLFRTAVIIVTGLLLSTTTSAQPPAPVEALDGVDPVVLLKQGKEVFGKSALSVDRGRFRYLFSSEETKATFEREPAKYEIQLGGLCARMGRTATGNPSDYLVHDNKIYIFGSDDCRKRFAAAPNKYLATPLPPMPASAQAVKRGRELLDRAVTAMGGAKVLDTVTSYSETMAQVRKRGETSTTIETRTIWRFPGEARAERTMAMPGATPFVTVLTPKEGWNIVQGRTYAVPEIAKPALEDEFGRHPIAILKARLQPGFKVAALEPATVDGTAVQRVRVQHGAVDATLALEPQSGRFHSIEFRERNIDSEIGTYTLIYSDFRNVGGLMVPHASRALFNGQPDTFLSSTVQAAAINPQIDPALFTRPAVSR